MAADEVLRARLIQRVDSLLSRWMISGQDRTLLNGLRGYVSTMTEQDLDRLKAFMPTIPFGASSPSLYKLTPARPWPDAVVTDPIGPTGMLLSEAKTKLKDLFRHARFEPDDPLWIMDHELVEVKIKVPSDEWLDDPARWPAPDTFSMDSEHLHITVEATSVAQAQETFLKVFGSAYFSPDYGGISFRVTVPREVVSDPASWLVDPNSVE